MGSGLIASPRATRPAKDGFGGRRTEDGKEFRSLSSVLCRPSEAKLDLEDGERTPYPFSVLSSLFSERAFGAHWRMRAIKSNERLVPVSSRIAAFPHPAYRRGGLPRLFKGELVLRLVSRLDAFSGYPFRI